MAELTRQRRLVITLHILTLLLFGLHMVVRFLPPTPTPIPSPSDAESAWWGLWPATYPPTWAMMVSIALLFGTMAYFWQQERRHRPAINETELTYGSKNRITTVLLALSALLVIAFFAFPIAHTRWGDAYMLAKSIAWPDPALRLTNSWQAPLDVFIHSWLWRTLGESFGWHSDATPVYRLISPLAGACYLVIVLRLARDKRLAPPWLTYGLLASLGLMQLFFGYVENYSLAAVGVLAYLWLGIGLLHRRHSLWLAATALALTNATHPSTIVLTPSLLYLGWQSFEQDRSRGALRSGVTNLLQMALPMLVVAAITVLAMERSGHGLAKLVTSDRPGGGDARLFVPLWEATTRWEHYTLFSWPHLRDFLNEQLLVAPVVLPSLLLLALFFLRIQFDVNTTTQFWRIYPWWDSQEKNRKDTGAITVSVLIVRFLSLCTLLYLMFILIWNPDYGGQRDWDLFSLAALPSSLLLIALLPLALTRRWYLLMGAVPLILLQSLHTLSWIYQNTLPWSWP